jgi:hypothetical protein
MLGFTNSPYPANPPCPISTPSKPWILILKLILLPFYLFLWDWMSLVLLLTLGNVDEDPAESVLGDVVRVLEVVVVLGLVRGLMGRF